MSEERTKKDPFSFAGELNYKHADQAYSNQSFWQDVFLRLAANRVATISAVIILLVILFALLAPVFSSYSYKEVNTAASNLPPRVPGLEKFGFMNGTFGGKDLYAMKGMKDVYHYFGTDNLGRDVWTRCAMGCRISLLIAAIAVVIDIFIGIVYGMIAGYFGGTVDLVMMRVIEIISGIPTLVVLTLLLLILKPGLTSIIIAMVFSGWISMSRIVRAQTLKLKNMEYVLASRTLGASSFRILREDILPNTLGQIIVTFMFSIPNAIFTEAFLAFIGLGVPAPLASLGTMINDGYKSAMVYPYMVVLPIIVLGLLMLCFNLFADGLRDAVDPQMKTL